MCFFFLDTHGLSCNLLNEIGHWRVVVRYGTRMYVMGGWLVWMGFADSIVRAVVRGLRRFGLWYGSQSKGIKKDIWTVSRVQCSTV